MKSAVLRLSKLSLPGFDLGKLISFFLYPIAENGVLLSSFVAFGTRSKRALVSLVLSSKLFKVNLKQPLIVNNRFDFLTDQRTAFNYYRLIYNSVIGSFKFWFDELELVGLGYRLTLKGGTLRLRLGFSHVLILTIPSNVFLIKRKKRLLIYSTDRSDLTHFISRLLRLRKMSVYKIKGIKKKAHTFNLKPGKKRAK